PMKPSWEAAALVTSMTRPLTKGPRSLMRTTTARPLPRFSTLTWVPKGSVRCAAAIVPALIRSPLAVLDPKLYQEAPPHWLVAALASCGWKNADAVEATPAMVNAVTLLLNPTLSHSRLVEPHHLRLPHWKPRSGRRGLSPSAWARLRRPNEASM